MRFVAAQRGRAGAQPVQIAVTSRFKIFYSGDFKMIFANEVNKKIYWAISNNKMDRVAEYLSSGLYDRSDDAMLISLLNQPAPERGIIALINAGWNTNSRDPHFNPTAIMLAALNGLTSVVEELIIHGGDVNAKDDTGSTAALHACRGKSSKNTECLKLLVKHGIDVNEGRFHSPLMWAISDGTQEIVSVLLEAGADPNRYYGRGNALYAAIENNRPNFISLLLKHGADPQAVIPSPWYDEQFAGLTLLEFAKRMKRPKIVAILEGKPLPVSSAKVTLLPALWKQFKKRLQELDADPAEILNPGASAEQITELESALQCELPASIKKSWMIHDGQPQQIACFRLTGNDIDNLLTGEADLYRLLPCSEIIEEQQRAADSYASELANTSRYQAESGIAAQACSATWLPLARNLCGNFLCCDLAPPEGGTFGQIILVSSESPIRTRVANDWCECLENLGIGTVEDED